MVSENSGGIWHNFIDMDDTVVSNRCSEYSSLLGFAVVHFLRPCTANNNPVVHLLHSGSSDGILRLPIRSVLLRGGQRRVSLQNARSSCCNLILSAILSAVVALFFIATGTIITHMYRSIVKRWINALIWVAVTAAVLALILGICYGESKHIQQKSCTRLVAGLAKSYWRAVFIMRV